MMFKNYILYYILKHYSNKYNLKILFFLNGDVII